MADADVVGIIEAAYDHTASDSDWIEGLAAKLRPSFGRGAPVAVFSFRIEGDQILSGHTSAHGPMQGSALEPLLASMDGATRRRAFLDCPILTTLSQAIGPTRARSALAHLPEPVPDMLGLRASSRHDEGVIVCTPTGKATVPRQRALWMRIASHVGAGLRLRTSRRSAPDDALAVLDASGKLVHGEPAVQRERAALAEATRRMDVARGRLRRLDGAAATELWRSMVACEWSLVDWIDHDGKRFLLVEENRPHRGGITELSRREAEVAACAAMGHSNKLIAYDLGISRGAVTTDLRRASIKLGVTSRVELIRRFRERTSERS